MSPGVVDRRTWIDCHATCFANANVLSFIAVVTICRSSCCRRVILRLRPGGLVVGDGPPSDCTPVGMSGW